MKRLILLFTMIVILITIPADTLISQISRPDGTIDMARFFLGDQNTFPRFGPNSNGHPPFFHTNQFFYPEKKLLFFVKFDDPRTFEAYSWDDEWIYLHEDHSLPFSSYTHENARWAKRFMKIGETIENYDNYLIEYNDQCQVVRYFWFPFKNTLDRYLPNVDLGKDLGRRDVIVLMSTPEPWAVHQDFELHYLAKDAGPVMWQEWQYWKLKYETSFTQFGGLDIKPARMPCTPPRR